MTVMFNMDFMLDETCFMLVMVAELTHCAPSASAALKLL